MSYSGSNGGSIHTDSDVALSNPVDGQLLSFNGGLAKWQNIVPPPAGAQALVTTGVKTAAYTAAAADLVPVDASNAAVIVTLPTAPADKSRVVVKKIDGSANAVTITAAGNDVFNKASGNTSLALSILNQSLNLQYSSSNAVWYAVGSDTPLTQLDLRYVATAAEGIAGGVPTLDSSGLVPTNQLPLSAQSITITGSGAPSSSAGLNGDYYLDYASGKVYSKTSGAWGSSLGTIPGNDSSLNVVSKTAAYTAASGDVVFANGTFTVTSPTSTSGYQVTVKNAGNGTITFVPASGTVDGASSFILNTQYLAKHFICDGTNWGVF